VTIKRLTGLKFLFLLVFLETIQAQERPFLFTFTAPPENYSSIIINYDAAYSSNTFEPLGHENIEQAIGVHAGFGESFTFFTKLGMAFNNKSVRSSQHIEMLMHIIKSKDNMVDLSLGSGLLHEYSGTNVLLARAVVGRRFSRWQIYSNALFEKPFSRDRDALDLFVTIGWSYQMTRIMHLGLELVGQDLEGFWEIEEAEGGALLFAGPTLVVKVPDMSWTFTLGGGPIIRATQSSQASLAPRELPIKENGYVIHAALNYAL